MSIYDSYTAVSVDSGVRSEIGAEWSACRTGNLITISISPFKMYTHSYIQMSHTYSCVCVCICKPLLRRKQLTGGLSADRRSVAWSRNIRQLLSLHSKWLSLSGSWLSVVRKKNRFVYCLFYCFIVMEFFCLLTSLNVRKWILVFFYCYYFYFYFWLLFTFSIALLRFITCFHYLLSVFIFRIR